MDINYSPSYHDTVKAHSQKRLFPYLRAVNFKEDVAVKLYFIQQHLSMICLGIIINFEVILRNAIDRHMETRYTVTNDWIMILLAQDETNPFWDQKNRCISRKMTNSYAKLIHVKQSFHKTHPNQNITHDDIIASLPFGFWTDLFYQYQYVALGDDLLTIFADVEVTKDKRKEIKTKLDEIRNTRNRCAHGKPIILRNNRIDFTILDTRMQNILNLSEKLGVNTELYIPYLDEYARLKNIIEEMIS